MEASADNWMDEPNGYRIGAVTQRTGLTADCLRAWERRHDVVRPQRGGGGHRVYSEADIRKLSLLRRLVDAGEAIGAISSLDVPALEQRLAAAENGRPARRSVALYVAGTLAVDKLKPQLPTSDFRLTGEAASLADAASRFRPDRDGGMPMLVAECESLDEIDVAHLIRLIDTLQPSHTLLLHRFLPRHLRERLARHRVSLLRSPLPASDLRQILAARHLRGAETTETTETADASADRDAPPPRFSRETLRRLAAMQPTLICECPKHLSELLTSLLAFEDYSQQCEDRSPEDADTHAFLRAATGRARVAMEQALVRVLRHDGIDPEAL
ncbi:MerR family transcriptional regulator [Salinisphaera sp. P385]|uniref:MerR family transcriptional regulator n=1 Tax=Spectribacter acetivorans TaxID=3075603 RepID=A0ABU3BAW9_9GAMM|nr:MerR family transcriptional regulator [Salinisphaera sp. P385]MDT0619611.1 MerR family transcriptional regulator [Salinisphaera sp. P385]